MFYQASLACLRALICKVNDLLPDSPTDSAITVIDLQIKLSLPGALTLRLPSFSMLIEMQDYARPKKIKKKKKSVGTRANLCFNDPSLQKKRTHLSMFICFGFVLFYFSVFPVKTPRTTFSF